MYKRLPIELICYPKTSKIEGIVIIFTPFI